MARTQPRSSLNRRREFDARAERASSLSAPRNFALSVVGEVTPVAVQPAAQPSILMIDLASPDADAAAALLRGQGFRVVQAESMGAAWAALAADGADLILLEPGVEPRGGADLCRKLRQGSDAALLVYSRRADALERVAALEFGADDVLHKDCHELEFLARVRALLRRTARQAAPPERASGWSLHRATRVLTAPTGRSAWLSASECALLVLFADRPAARVGPAEFAHLVATAGEPGADSGLRVRISRIRRRLREAGCPDLPIRTLRPGGYVFEGLLTSVE